MGRELPAYLTEKTKRRRVVGTRAEVMHGTMDRTSGGLTSEDLMYQYYDETGKGYGRIISKAKHELGKKRTDFLEWLEANQSRVIAHQFKKGHGKINKGDKVHHYTPKIKEKSPEAIFEAPAKRITRAMAKSAAASNAPSRMTRGMAKKMN
jgi:hypothetical protein